jgi:hypothetical protein
VIIISGRGVCTIDWTAIFDFGHATVAGDQAEAQIPQFPGRVREPLGSSPG